MQSTLQEYSAAAAGESSDPFGKVTFPVVFSAMDEEVAEEKRKLFVAQITPVIHYSLGGIKVTAG